MYTIGGELHIPWGQGLLLPIKWFQFKNTNLGHSSLANLA